jgi:glycosyltransferase involved in cell wall biosynthesis
MLHYRRYHEAGIFGIHMSTDTFNGTLSIVIPVYNSAPILPDLIAQLGQALPALAPHYEAILVDDGSKDESWSVVQDLVGQYDWVRGFHLMRNYGQHNALLCGIRQARYDVIVTMDDDLQHPPPAVQLLLDELAKGYDVVYGMPTERPHGLWRNLSSSVTHWVLYTATGGVATARDSSAFRAFHTRIRDAFASYDSTYVSIDVLLTWGATRFGSVPVQFAERKVGQSNYTFSKLVWHTVTMLTGFSVLPLRFASVIGLAFAALGLVMLIYVIGRFLLEGGSIPGFPFLASSLAIFAGVQLLVLGIIGEYLAQIHFRTMKRPPYVIAGQAGAVVATSEAPSAA